jgi:hypothetical protein
LEAVIMKAIIDGEITMDRVVSVEVTSKKDMLQSDKGILSVHMEFSEGKRSVTMSAMSIKTVEGKWRPQ